MNAAVAVYALLFAPPDVLPSEWPDDYRAYVAAYRESYLAAEQDKLKAVQKEALQNRGGVGYKERLRTFKKRISVLKRAGYVLEPVLFGEDPF